MITIYTDGSCRGNGKENSEGGWGYVVYDASNRIIEAASARENSTTNNRMELKALINALEWFNVTFIKGTEEAEIYSDSAYVVNTFNDWIHNWASNNWINSSKKTPENLDLIKKLYNYAKETKPNYKVIKCKGHCGVQGNEIADKLATGKISPVHIQQ